ncbi:glycosyl hydrolase [Nocardioides sp.]|uniref:glycosyl hydrolase n=1 Tax=Nocardioides sp. TaxID=35761 RepID=UPI0027186AA4|nr:glycosyl hydrolase [Nocardioides sp.]MDO9454926.1 glycosyl hydrolase [Nocardioides sp.]
MDHVRRDDAPAPGRGRRVHLLTLVLLVATLLVVPRAGPERGSRGTGLELVDASGGEQSARTTALDVGVSPGFGLFELSSRALVADLTTARRAGLRHLRVDVGWARIEHAPGRYDWSATDRVLRAARSHGFQVLAVVGYRPGWAPPLRTVAARSAYARFVGRAARRYGSSVAAWELWNEPNLEQSWGVAPDARAYAGLVAGAARQLRAHDPGAPVVVGALSPAVDAPDGSQVSPMTFLSRFYASGIDRSLFDVVSVHPYSYPALPTDDADWNTFHRLPDLHALMTRAGDGAKQLWLTEYGAPTGRSSRSVSRRGQASMVVDAVRQASTLPFVGRLYLYALRDTARRPTDLEANFGLLDHRGRPKPALGALRRALHGTA